MTTKSNTPEGKIPVFFTREELSFLMHNIDKNITFAASAILRSDGPSEFVDKMYALQQKFHALRERTSRACKDEGIDPNDLREEYDVG